MVINEQKTIDGSCQDKQDVPVEYCVASGWMQIGVDIPETGRKWIEMRLPEEMWAPQSQISQRMDVLENTIKALSNWKEQLLLWNSDRV